MKFHVSVLVALKGRCVVGVQRDPGAGEEQEPGDGEPRRYKA